MSKSFRLKFFDFLSKHDLYDWIVFQYFLEQSVKLDYEDNIFIDCSLVLDRKDKLCTLVPCISNLKNDEDVAINIYVYVRWLMLEQKMGKVYNEDFYSQVLPLFYQKLYILENNNKILSNFDKKIEMYLLKDGSYDNQMLLQSRNILINSYESGKDETKKITKQVKRLTKKYIYYKNNNSK